MVAAKDVRPNPPQERPRLRAERAWIVIALILGAALAVVLVAGVMAPERHGEIWVEVAKSSLYLVALAVTGGVVAIVVRDRDAAREQERRRQEFLLSVRDEIDATFSQVKAARRLLRTYGFDAPAVAALDAEQVTGFRTQMAMLNEAELALEMHARKVGALADRFGGRAPAIERELAEVFGYLRLVLFEFEADPWSVTVGGSTAALQGWPHFLRFIRYDEASQQAFEEGVARRMARIELLILAPDMPHRTSPVPPS